MPSRRTIRAWLMPLNRRSTPRALALVAFDLALLGMAMTLTVLAPRPWVQALAGIATGLVIGRLFILGHDACHQSLTTHRTLNRWIGRIVFLP